MTDQRIRALALGLEVIRLRTIRRNEIRNMMFDQVILPAVEDLKILGLKPTPKTIASYLNAIGATTHKGEIWTWDRVRALYSLRRRLTGQRSNRRLDVKYYSYRLSGRSPFWAG